MFSGIERIRKVSVQHTLSETRKNNIELEELWIIVVVSFRHVQP
jgi:hypothetical protein